MPNRVKHPVERFLETASPRDLAVANELYEAGNSDEDLYAALGAKTPSKDRAGKPRENRVKNPLLRKSNT